MEIHNLVGILKNKGIRADVSCVKRNIIRNNRNRDKSHIHNYCEIYFNISGDVSFAVENKVYSVESGDLIITKPNEIHYCIFRIVFINAL